MDLSKSFDFFRPCDLTSRVHIIGCGSVGSTVAENLARFGITDITLYDFDSVEPHNIANQMFVQSDIYRPKIEAVEDMIYKINPDARGHVRLEPKGWTGQKLSGYIFLCCDGIELRKKIVEANRYNTYIKAMFDFRTGLIDAQHYAAEWSSSIAKENFLKSMNFTHDEAKEQTPVSACNVELSVVPTIRIIVGLGVMNFINFVKGQPLKHMIQTDTVRFILDAF